MRNFLKVFFTVAGMLLLCAALFLFLSRGPSVLDAPYITDAADAIGEENRYVVAAGNVVWNGEATDDLFGISVNSPLLIRKVETVQWYKSRNDEVYLTLSDKQLPDFEYDGKSYTNPQLNTQYTTEFFTADTTLAGLKVSSSLISQLAGGTGTDFSSQIPMVTIDELPFGAGEVAGLDRFGSFYATPGDEWQPGDIVVSFSYLDPAMTGEYTIFALCENGQLVEDGESGYIIWDKLMTADDITATVTDKSPAQVRILTASGAILLLAGILLFLIKKKSN